LTAFTPNCSRGSANGDNIFWHMSCGAFHVARKFQVSEGPKTAAAAAITNLQKTAVSLTGLRVAPRVRKIPMPRRRVPITIFPERSRSVIIRHVAQNLGSVVNEIQPVQSQRV
jgi:hypothetical protein